MLSLKSDSQLMKKIGIIGGMGPESTIFFYREIIKIFQKKFNAKYDSDYPEMFICNLPMPDMVNKISNEKIIKKMLSDSAKKLEMLEMDFIVIPCNTIHLFYNTVKKSVSIPVLNIIEETTKKIIASGYKKVGLFATEVTYKNNLYGKFFEKYNIELIVPNKGDKKQITKVIMNILNGRKFSEDKGTIRKITEKLINRGAECIILGCTDLPVLIKKKDINVELFDTIKILADSAVKFCFNIESQNNNKKEKI